MEIMNTAVQLSDATLAFGERVLWSGLSVNIKQGEFIAVLGPNGTGKSTFLKVLLGIVPLTSGSVRIAGKVVGADNKHIGYVPQQKGFDRSLPIRGRDLVEFGINGSQFGFRGRRAKTRQLVDRAIAAVNATTFADMPLGFLSGGEQQRLRIAQALVGEPDLLLCDEPMLSLDLTSQSTITNLLNEYRKRSNATVIFVTHEINPVLPWVDRVLYIANGRWMIDKPSRVLQSKTLTQLYGSPIEVLNIHGRLIVIGADEAAQPTPAHHEEEL